MLVATPAIANLIRENKTFRINSAIQTGTKHGMLLLDDSLFKLWKEGKGPARSQCGRKVLITKEAAAEWLRSIEVSGS